MPRSRRSYEKTRHIALSGLLFALGTDHGDQFVREQLYGVCDNLIYIHDAESTEWSPVGVPA